jgi:hypothetical protein
MIGMQTKFLDGAKWAEKQRRGPATPRGIAMAPTGSPIGPGFTPDKRTRRAPRSTSDPKRPVRHPSGTTSLTPEPRSNFFSDA